jgi:hypothetical protein
MGVGWSSITVRLEAPDREALRALPDELLALGSLSPRAEVLLIPIDSGGEKRLEDRLDRLREFFLVNEHLLIQASESCTSDVFIGWSPAASQESLTIDASLIQTLARLRLELVFDTYNE